MKFVALLACILSTMLCHLFVHTIVIYSLFSAYWHSTGLQE